MGDFQYASEEDRLAHMSPYWANLARQQQAFQSAAGEAGKFYFRPGVTGKDSVLVGNAAGGRETYDPAKHGAAPSFDDKARWDFSGGYGGDFTDPSKWSAGLRDNWTRNLGRTQPGVGAAPAPAAAPAKPGFAGVSPGLQTPAPAMGAPSMAVGAPSPAGSRPAAGGFAGVQRMGSTDRIRMQQAQRGIGTRMSAGARGPRL
jgi:hypothetical protein